MDGLVLKKVNWRKLRIILAMFRPIAFRNKNAMSQTTDELKWEK